MFKVNNKDTRTTLVTSCCCLYCWLWTFFTPYSSVSIVNFEQENAVWEGSCSSALSRHDEYKHHPKLVLKKFSLSNKNALIKISIVYNDSELLHLSSETLGLKATLVLQLLAICFTWNHFWVIQSIQSAFTCSKLTIETLKQGVKYVQN